MGAEILEAGNDLHTRVASPPALRTVSWDTSFLHQGPLLLAQGLAGARLSSRWHRVLGGSAAGMLPGTE